MNKLIEYIESNWLVFILIVISWNILFFGYLWVRKNRKGSIFPQVSEIEILYKEKFASGCSCKNIFTRLGKARYCLTLTITKNELWVVPFFPFNLVSGIYDLEHRIKKDSIKSIKESGFLGIKSFIITYMDEKQKRRTIKISPESSNDFIRILGRNIDK
jgi:hypothetical protein